MEKFVKKRNTAEKQSKETSAKKLKKDYDNEVVTTEQTTQIQKSSLICTAPIDIPTSEVDKPTQPCLKVYPKHSTGYFCAAQNSRFRGTETLGGVLNFLK